ncbi:MAG TPA: tetratricopeptide repeat protein [Rhizomicrobium sp.]|nr:tetratricopeptide repeat protein [Rhizomicrobium sp.]
MSDIFHEVEEDVRRERLEQLWKQYGDYIIAAVAAIAVGIAGYKLWERYETQQRLTASKTFVAAQDAAESGNVGGAAQAFGKLAKSGPTGYGTIATLAQADSLLASGNRSDAIKIYKTVAEKDTSPIAGVARIRAAWAMAEFTPKAELDSWLAPINDNSSAWRFIAREILAYSDYRAGSLAVALSEYKALAAEKDATPGQRQRAGAMATFIEAGGDKEYGTVPRPAPPPAPPQAAAPQGQPQGQPQP